jgi:hypothetical protein
MNKLLTLSIVLLEWFARRCFDASTHLDAWAMLLRAKRERRMNKRNP